MTDEKETAEEKLEKSKEENLHDEQSIKLLNAQLLVMREGKKGDEKYDHAAEVCEKLVAMVGGVAKHMDQEIVVIKEGMRAAFLKAVDGSSSEREALLIAANHAVAGFAELFDNLQWVDAQTQKFQIVIDEQVPEGFVRKGVKAVKTIVFAPVNLGMTVADTVVKTMSMGKISLKKKEKHVK